MKKPIISAIAAIGRNRELGKDNRLIWTISDDLKRFRKITTGHPIIMGRKTFESIGRVLPERTNIVVTRDGSWNFAGVTVTHTIEEALDYAKQKDEEEIFIIGGAQIYEAAMPYVERLYLTIVDAENDADTFFPPYGSQFKKMTFEEEHMLGDLKYTWVVLEK